MFFNSNAILWRYLQWRMSQTSCVLIKVLKSDNQLGSLEIRLWVYHYRPIYICLEECADDPRMLTYFQSGCSHAHILSNILPRVNISTFISRTILLYLLICVLSIKSNHLIWLKRNERPSFKIISYSIYKYIFCLTCEMF